MQPRLGHVVMACPTCSHLSSSDDDDDDDDDGRGMLLLLWEDLLGVHSALFTCRRYGFSQQDKQEKVRLPPTSAPSETSSLSNISTLSAQVDARKTPASGVAQAGAEVSEEDELQEAEEVSRWKSEAAPRNWCESEKPFIGVSEEDQKSDDQHGSHGRRGGTEPTSDAGGPVDLLTLGCALAGPADGQRRGPHRGSAV